MVTQKEIFYQYLLNERDRLEDEVVQLRQNQRMKKNIDAIDCLELALAMERLSAFIDYSDHALAIFKFLQITVRALLILIFRHTKKPQKH